MRVAALYDIHANLPALEAVLEEISRIGVDHIVVGGDVFPGPMPRETLSRLRALERPVSCIYGNGEIAVLQQRAGKDPAHVPEQHRPVIRWTAQQLDSDQERILASWPKSFSLKISGLGTVLFCHATPRDENELFTKLTPETQLLPIFEDLNVSAVVCGHTHMQFDRVVGATRVINAGSVGMPFGRPGADWLLLGPNVECRHTEYDLDRAAEEIRNTEYPGAEEFAANNVLQPPSEAKMLELLEKATLK